MTSTPKPKETPIQTVGDKSAGSSTDRQRSGCARTRSAAAKWVALGLLVVVIVAVIVAWTQLDRQGSGDQSSAQNESKPTTPTIQLTPQPFDTGTTQPSLRPSPRPSPGHTPSPSPRPTYMPTPAPSSRPSEPQVAKPAPTPQQSSSFCDAEFVCITDRVGHNTIMLAGQALCNDEFRFGLTKNGTFVWHDCFTDESLIVNVSPTNLGTDRSNTYLIMDQKATLRIRDSSAVLWRKESNEAIDLYPQCLQRLALDCPYFHLHKDGVVVLNWIDTNHRWHADNIKAQYDDLFLK